MNPLPAEPRNEAVARHFPVNRESMPDDDREALARLISEAENCTDEEGAWALPEEIADAVIAAGFRRQGPITKPQPTDDQWDKALDDRRVRAEAGEEGYRAAISDLRWLADRRDEYGGPRKVENVTDYFALSDSDKRIYDAVKDVHHTADILAGDNDGCGWLPSWRWDEWERRKSARAEADRSKQDERERVMIVLPDRSTSEEDIVTHFWNSEDRYQVVTDGPDATCPECGYPERHRVYADDNEGKTLTLIADGCPSCETSRMATEPTEREPW